MRSSPADLEPDVTQAQEVVAELRPVLSREREQRRVGREGIRDRDDLGRVEVLRAEPFDDPRCDGDRADDALDVSPPHLQPLEPVVRLVRA